MPTYSGLLKPIHKFVQRNIYRDPFMRAIKQWKREQRKGEIRYEYDIRKDDVVLDIGGYHGDYAREILDRHDCEIHVFEPMHDFAEHLRDRFRGIDQVKVYQYGLADSRKEMDLNVSGDATSFCTGGRENSESQVATLKDFAEVWQELGVSSAKLVKMNIEGGEYPLLNRIIETGLQHKIDNFLIQFHDFVPDAHHERDRIREALQETHQCDWSYPFVWESWSRK